MALKPRDPPPRRLQDQAGAIGAPRWIHEAAASFLATQRTCADKICTAIQIAVDRNPERDLSCAEICSGWGETSYCIRQHGGSSQEYDGATRQTPDENITTEVGMLLAAYHVARVMRGGCVIMSPECSTRLPFLSVYHTF